ncbi:unnamed protein product [Acanthoscelides obtectus]|uniref:Uncharacterized protein n=1 Tax=Acanthoscelides obtectus TaxID=200917 RepID=A0A9P0KPN6_ACAOB|nr:unnamed protein product [Acanthoscelides obtectus]CAK1651947.1 hypothetical protein AOBTE_LOCUS17568 [Acanthoscelides obtectus]
MAIQRLNSILWYSKISINTKVQVYHSIVEPITAYGAECRQLTKIENQLKAVEMDFLRRSCRLSRLDHIRNDMIRERTCVQDTIVDRVERRQLVWYGDVMRIADERWPRKMVSISQPTEGRVERDRRSHEKTRNE